MRYMFMFQTTWLVALVVNLVFAFTILGITWVLQTLNDNPTVHEYATLMFNGMLFSNHVLIYLLLFVSFLTIALVSFFICVNRIKFVSKKDAQRHLTTVTEDNVWYWVYKKQYCAESPKLTSKGKTVTLSLAAAVSPIALALTNLILVIISMVIIVLCCELSPVLKH